MTDGSRQVLPFLEAVLSEVQELGDPNRPKQAWAQTQTSLRAALDAFAAQPTTGAALAAVTVAA